VITERGQQNVRAVLLNDLLDLVQPLKQDIVDLTCSDRNVLDKGLCRHDQLMQPLFGLKNIVLALTRNDDLVSCSWEGANRSVAEDGREEWWKIDCSIRSRLDELDVASMSSADEVVQRKLEFDSVYLSHELVFVSMYVLRQVVLSALTI